MTPDSRSGSCPARVRESLTRMHAGKYLRVVLSQLRLVRIEDDVSDNPASAVRDVGVGLEVVCYHHLHPKC